MFELGTEKGIGSLKGAVRFPTLVRIVLPGCLATGLLLPFRPIQADLSKGIFDEKLLPVVLALLLIALLLGWLTDRLGDAIYRFYEGRSFWPDRLRNKRIEQNGKRVRSLLAEAKDAKAKNEFARRDEIWSKLRRYPIDESGKPFASHPTLLGNILAAYEVYSETRYGMDSVFFWPRLWLALPRETREEIDQGWAPADGLLNMSAISYIAGIASLITGTIMGIGYRFALVPSPWHGVQVPFSRADASLLWGLAALFFGYLFYRMSIPFHLRNGETFKSVFDLYRDLLQPMVVGGGKEPEKWQRTWAYLQYQMIPCAVCGTYYEVQKERCPQPNCTGSTTESLQALRETTEDTGDLLHLTLKVEKKSAIRRSEVEPPLASAKEPDARHGT
jgi:hypothetical protein